MQKITTILVCLLCTFNSIAQNRYDKYYAELPIQLEKVQTVTFPSTIVKLTQFAAVSDGETLCTDAFAAAIDSLNKAGGGHLIVPKGTWKTGPIILKSNIDLHLNRGAVIIFSENKALYIPEDMPLDGSQKCLPCISAKHCTNVGITGNGTLDGQGFFWRPIKQKKVVHDGNLQEIWNEALSMGGVLKPDDKTYFIWYPFNLKPELGVPNIAATPEIQEKMRPHLINITDSKNVVVQGVTLKNSPKFHLVPTRVQNLIIENVTVDCPWWAQNGDAIDPGNIQTGLIAGCHIQAGDDGICLKGGVGDQGVKAGPCKDILIINDTVLRAHGGFVIGSEFSGGMQKIVVKDCMFDGTDIGCRFKSAPGRGGWCEDIYCVNIIMKNIRETAISFISGYADKAVGGISATANDNKSTYFPEWSNFTFKDIICVNPKQAVSMTGIKGLPIHDIRFDNVKFYGCKEGVDISYGQNIYFTNLTLTPEQAFNLQHSRDINVNGKNIE